jgi:hypothetical protein
VAELRKRYHQSKEILHDSASFCTQTSTGSMESHVLEQL